MGQKCGAHSGPGFLKRFRATGVFLDTQQLLWSSSELKNKEIFSPKYEMCARMQKTSKRQKNAEIQPKAFFRGRFWMKIVFCSQLAVLHATEVNSIRPNRLISSTHALVWPHYPMAWLSLRARESTGANAFWAKWLFLSHDRGPWADLANFPPYSNIQNLTQISIGLLDRAHEKSAAERTNVKTWTVSIASRKVENWFGQSGQGQLSRVSKRIPIDLNVTWTCADGAAMKQSFRPFSSPNKIARAIFHCIGLFSIARQVIVLISWLPFRQCCMTSWLSGLAHAQSIRRTDAAMRVRTPIWSGRSRPS